MTTGLEDVSTEILIKIFEYCSIPDLCRLQQTCKRFCEIIKNTTTLGNTNPLLSTNQFSKRIRNRSFKLLSLRDKYRISFNWRDGLYKEVVLVKESKRYIPHFILKKENLWISKGNRINIYNRRRKNYLEVKSNIRPIIIPKSTDICKFKIEKHCLISGQSDGSVYIWKSHKENLHLVNCHESDIHSVDLKEDKFVSGGKDGTIKLWHLKSKLQLPYVPLESMYVGDRIWSTCFCEKGTFLAAGTAGHNRVAPLHLLDLNRFTVIHELGKDFAQGSGVLDLKWENPYMLLSCGYDKNIRYWDLRIGKCVQSWVDPFYATVYCLDTDNYCTMVSGTQSHGRVVLWDMRSTRYVQVYFMETCRKLFRSSPIYRLSFDACQLFTATDLNLHVLDFSVKNGLSRNYNMVNFNI